LRDSYGIKGYEKQYLDFYPEIFEAPLLIHCIFSNSTIQHGFWNDSKDTIICELER